MTNKWFSNKYIAQSAGAVEYTDCISAEGKATPHLCPEYDTKQSNGEVPVILELWRMQITPSLPSLPALLCPEVVGPEIVLSMGQIEINGVLMLN